MLSAVSLGGITYLDLSLKITVKLRYSSSEIIVFNVMVDMSTVCFRRSIASFSPRANAVSLDSRTAVVIGLNTSCQAS